MQTSVCAISRQPFTISDRDVNFYQRFHLPLPTLSPEERRRRRLLHRNDRILYRRTCDLTGVSMLSINGPDVPFPVYAQDAWWSDRWDAMQYGRPFNFSKPFFSQWNALNRLVPHIALWTIQNQNTDFAHDASYNKNCYMIFGADYNQDCYYSWSCIRNKNVVDSSNTFDCERCYECLDCFVCHFCMFSELLRNCSDCVFSFDCINCHNCFGCTGFRNTSYCWFNEQLTPDEYKRRLASVRYTPGNIQDFLRQAREAGMKVPRRFVIQRQCEDSTGSYLGQCKDVYDSFDVYESRDCAYATISLHCRNVWDGDILFYNVEVAYEVHTLIKNCLNVFFSEFARDLKESFYCNECYSSQNLFGCVGLRHKQYCILNQQYSRQEYEALVPKIIEHMRTTGEWGEFFPASLSPYPYNETFAQDIFPMTKDEAGARGYRWRDSDPRTYQAQTCVISDDISNVPDSIIHETLACEICEKNYRLIPQEISFYRSMKLPVPRQCFSCRHTARFSRRQPRKLWERACSKCQALIRSTYAPDRKEAVYCEACYLAFL